MRVRESTPQNAAEQPVWENIPIEEGWWPHLGCWSMNSYCSIFAEGWHGTTNLSLSRMRGTSTQRRAVGTTGRSLIYRRNGQIWYMWRNGRRIWKRQRNTTVKDDASYTWGLWKYTIGNRSYWRVLRRLTYLFLCFRKTKQRNIKLLWQHNGQFWEMGSR